MYILSGHVKKTLKVTDRFVNGGGGGEGQPPVRNQNRFFI